MTSFDPAQLPEHQARLRSLAAAIVGERLADDVLQDTWVAALTGNWREPERLPAWLARVTRNLAWKRRLGDERRQAREWHASRDEALCSTHDLLEQIEQGHFIERCLTELDEPYRSTLLWRFYEDLPIAEISRRSGVPESTTRTHMQRGLQKLRDRLESKRGPEWRAALVPLLKPKSSGSLAVPAGSGTGLGGMLMSTLAKPMLAGVLLISTWVLWDRGFPAEELAPLEDSLSVDTSPALPLADLDGSPGPPLVEDPRVALQGGTAVPSPATVPGATPSAQRFRLLDPRSERGLEHGEVVLEHASKTHRLTSGPGGLFEAPGRVSSADLDAPRPTLTAELVVPGVGRSYGVTCKLSAGRDNEELELRPVDAWAFAVSMPNSTRPSDLTSLTARVSYTFASGRVQAAAQRYKPIHVDRDLLYFVLPPLLHLDGGIDELAGLALLLSTDKAGTTFQVELERNASLKAGPYPARLVNLVEQPVRVVETTSGVPIAGVFVSLRQLGRPNATPLEWANGVTNKEGELSLSGVPPGRQLALFHKKGFAFTKLEVEVLGGPQVLDLSLQEISGKTDLEVSLACSAGPVPAQLHLTAILLPLENIEASGWLEARPLDTGGWETNTTLTNLPPGRYRLHVSSSVPGLGTLAPFLSDVPAAPVHIQLDPPPPSRPLYLRLPRSIRQASVWIEMESSLRLVARDSYDNGKVATVSDQGAGQIWMVHAAGHVPIHGNRSEWTSAQGGANNGPIFELRPKFTPGWGALLQIYGPEGPIEGARVQDLATGVQLGRSDANGYVLIRARENPERVEILLGEGRQRQVELTDKPFLHCYLKARKD